MVEESDKSDSRGSLLINEILSKFNHVSGKKSDNHNDDQDKHLLIGSERPKITKEVSKNMVTKKVVNGLHPKRYKSDNKFTSNTPTMTAWCKERQKKGYGQRIMMSQSTDSIKKDNEVKIMNVKSLKDSDQNPVQTSNVLTTDFIEDKIDLVELSLAPVKSSELSPAQVGNEKGSETIPAQTDIESSVLSSRSV